MYNTKISWAISIRTDSGVIHIYFVTNHVMVPHSPTILGEVLFYFREVGLNKTNMTNF